MTSPDSLLKPFTSMKVTSLKKVYLVGDGVLDNFHWLSSPERDLTHELKELNFEVRNFAVEETRVDDVLHGISPNHTYQKSRTYPYDVDVNGRVCPLTLIKPVRKGFASVYDTTKNDTMIVLSVGGFNIKSKLMKIIGGVSCLMDSVLTPKFIGQYDQIIQELKSNAGKVVLVSIYLPYLGEGAKYAKYAQSTNTMIQKWNEFLYKTGEKYNVPILDLEKTINSQNRELYSVKSQKHLGDRANKCLAQCLAKIYNEYEGYKVYFAPNCEIEQFQSM